MSKVVCLTEYRGRKAVRDRQNREYMMNLTREVLRDFRTKKFTHLDTE